MDSYEKMIKKLNINKYISIPKGNLAKDLLVTVTAQVMMMILALLLNKIISINFTIEQFAIYNISKRTSTLLTYIMIIGLGISLPRYLSLNRKESERQKYELSYFITAIILLVLTAICVGIIFLGFKSIFSNLIFASNKYKNYITSIYVYGLSQSLMTIILSYYRGIGKFLKYAVVQIAVQIVIVIIAFLNKNNGIINLLNFWTIVCGLYGFSVCLKLIFKNLNIIKEIKCEKIVIQTLMELFRYGMPRVAGEFVLFSFTVIPLIIANNKIGVNSSAHLSVAISTLNIILPFFGFVGYVLLPYVSKMVSSGDMYEANNKIKKLLIIYIVISIIFIIFFYIFGALIVKIMYTTEYLTSLPIIKIIVLSILPQSVYLLLRNPIDAVSSFPYNTINLIVSFIILNLFIIISNSVEGMAIGFFVSYSILGLMSLISWKKCIYKNGR